MLADYDRVLQALKKARSVQVIEAEVQIKELLLANIQTFSCLHQAIKDATIPHQEKIISVTFINNLIFQNRTEYTQQMMFGFISRLLIDELVQSKYKRILLRALTSIMEINDQENLIKWKNFAYEVFHQHYQSALLIVSALAASEVSIEILYDIIKDLLEVSFLIPLFQSQNPEQWIKTQQILITWNMILDVLLRQDDGESYSWVQYMANCRVLCDRIYNIYQSFVTNNHYFSTQGLQVHPDLRQKINEIKAETAEIHLKIITQTFKHRENTYLIQLTGEKGEMLSNSIVLGAYTYNYILKLDCANLLLLYLQIFKMLCSMVPEATQAIWMQLVNYILIPFLKATNEQLQYFEDDPAAFMQLFEDCCEKQKLKTLKTEAAQFLEILCDNSQKFKMDSIPEYIDMLCLSSIKHHLKMQQFPNLSLMPLETAFQVLSIFSFRLSSKPSIINELKIILCDSRLSQLPPLELSRIFMFLAYNYTEIYPNGMQGYHWVQLAINTHSNTTTQYCGIDFLYNIIDHIYNDSIMETIITKILIAQNINFWQLLRKLLNYHLPKLSHQLTYKLAEICVQRIKGEIQKLEQRKIKKTAHLIHIIQVFKIIMGAKSYIQNKYELRQKIWQCTAYYRNAVKYDIEDQMIQLINLFLKLCDSNQIQKIPRYQQFLNELLAQFKLEILPQNYYFIGLNNYIVKGSFNEMVYPIFLKLKESFIALTANLQEKATLVRQKICISHYMILFENLIYLFGASLPASQVEIIFKLMQKFYPNEEFDLISGQIVIGKIFDKHILSRALNIQYLLCLCSSSNNKGLESIIQAISKYHKYKIYYGLDMKVLYLCIKEQINTEIDLQILKNLISILTKSLFYYLQRLKNQKDIDKKYKQENQENPSTKIIIHKAQTYQSLVKSIHLPFENLIKGNIRHRYASLMTELKNKNAYLFEGLVKSMDEDAQIYMQKIIGKTGQDQQSVKKQKVENQDKMGEQPRKIFTVSGIKNGQSPEITANLVSQSNKNEQLDFSSDSDDDIESGKRAKSKEQFDSEDESEYKQAVIARKRRKKLTQ